MRTHLSGLVYHAIVAVDDPEDASGGLTPEKWAEICVNGVVRWDVCSEAGLHHYHGLFHLFVM